MSNSLFPLHGASTRINDEREPPEINTANKDKNNFVSVMCVDLNIFCCDQMSRDSRFGRLTHVTCKVNTIFVEMSIDLQWISRIIIKFTYLHPVL